MSHTPNPPPPSTPAVSLDLGENWPTVLVVDDVDDNRIILRRRLMVAHFKVDEARDGAECLEMLAKRRYDAVLLDYMMPGLDGLATLKLIREKHSRLELPVIMVTARDEDPLVIKALESGANDYVSKPFSFPVLVARMRAQLEVAKAQAQA